MEKKNAHYMFAKRVLSSLTKAAARPVLARRPLPFVVRTFSVPLAILFCPQSSH
jgi:hypothetical protein